MVRIITILFLSTVCGLSQGFTYSDNAWVGHLATPSGAAAPEFTPTSGYTNNLFAYYDFQLTNSPEYILDTISTNHLIVDNYPVDTTVASGLIGECGQLNVSGVDWRADSNDNFKFWTNSFAIKFWYRYSGTIGTTLINRHNFQVSFATGGKPRFQVTDTNLIAFRVTNSVAVNIGAWNQITVFWERGVNMGIALNGAAPEYASPPMTNDLRVPVSTPFIITGRNSSGVDDQKFDEIAVWTDWVPTADDIGYDWNNGAGKGQPTP